ncbi:MAG: PilW family protein [Patescibacteria group bacterium]
MKNNEMWIDNKGFTLVEVLVAMTVFIIASIMFMSTFNLVSQTTMRVESSRLAQQDARYAIEQISREIRNGWDFEVRNPTGAQEGKALFYATSDTNGNEQHYLISEQYLENDTRTIVRQLVDSNGNPTGGSTPLPMLSTVVGLTDKTEGADDGGLRFRLIEPASEYPAVEIEMTVQRENAERFSKPLSVITRVTSRMRGEELKSRNEG